MVSRGRRQGETRDDGVTLDRHRTCYQVSRALGMGTRRAPGYGPEAMSILTESFGNTVWQLGRGKKLSFSRIRVTLLFISRFIHVNHVYTLPTEGRVVGTKTGKYIRRRMCVHAILLVSGNRTRLNE